MLPDDSSRKRRIASRGQLLKTEEEMARSRSVGTKKRVALLPAAFLSYALAWYRGTASEAGSSRPWPLSPSSSSSSGYRDYVMPGESDSSDESDDALVVQRDFADSDVVRLCRRSERVHLHETSAEERELAEALQLIERQEAEERAVEHLRRQEAEKANEVAEPSVIHLD